MLDRITPLILTYNEAPNIRRTLEQLRWARDIVVLDSFSDDETLELVSGFPQARIFQRQFDHHDRQWNFGLKETFIATEWVMALDADFIVTPALIAEIQSLDPADAVAGYRAPFVFIVKGHELRSAICPPAAFLYRRSWAEYVLDGHTQKLNLKGEVQSLRSPINHDDRKPLSRWFDSQKRYARLEAEKLFKSPAASLDLADRVRRLRIIAPVAMAFYCLIVRGGILDGWPGFYYAFQRMTAELMLSLYLIEGDLRSKPGAEVSQAAEIKLADAEEAPSAQADAN